MSLERIFKGDSRTVLVKKNIVGSFAIKGWSCIVQLLLVPITLDCLNQYEYGIWLTISSVLLWIDQFDIGLGNGLRNKLAEALAKGDKQRARSLVSTTFFTLFGIFPLLLAVIVAIFYTDCHALLNVNPNMIPNLQLVIAMSVAIVGVTFVFKIIGNIYLALQLPALNNLIVVAGQTLSLLVIWGMSLLEFHSFLLITIAYTLCPLIIYLIAAPITFSKYGYLTPSISRYNGKDLKTVFSLGINFFLTQVAGLFIFASTNIIIARVLSPAEVTVYQIAYRYFGILLMAYSIISIPLWSASTDAYAKGDWAWISHMVKKMNRLALYAFLGLGIMLLISEPVYAVWVGKDVTIGYEISAVIALYVGILIYSTCYSNILFGIGKIRLITIVTCIEAVIYIPLACVLGNRLGLTGIVWSLVLVNLMCAGCNKIQFSKLQNHTATGIWLK